MRVPPAGWKGPLGSPSLRMHAPWPPGGGRAETRRKCRQAVPTGVFAQWSLTVALGSKHWQIPDKVVTHRKELMSCHIWEQSGSWGGGDGGWRGDAGAHGRARPGAPGDGKGGKPSARSLSWQAPSVVTPVMGGLPAGSPRSSRPPAPLPAPLTQVCAGWEPVQLVAVGHPGPVEGMRGVCSLFLEPDPAANGWILLALTG